MEITEAVLKELIKSKFRYCIMTAKHITGRQDIAEDCAVMALMALWQRQAEIKELKYAEAFLYVATKNFALNELREKAARDKYEGGIVPPDQPEIDTDFKSISEAALKEVERHHYKSRKYVEVLRAHMNGFNNKEIALLLGIKYQYVRNIKRVVFAFLKEMFAH